MSLVQRRWIIIACAGALAVGAPMVMLRGSTPNIVLAPLPAPTNLMIRETSGLSFATTAPPFTPGRLAGATETGEAAQPAVPPAPLPKLVGLVVSGRGRGVALVRGSNGETVTLAIGEAVDGWELVSLGRERAVFDLNGDRQAASLDFSNKASGAAAAAATPPPSPLAPPPLAPSVPAPPPPPDRN